MTEIQNKQNKQMPKDPICGMDVSPSTNLKLDVGGETFYFCNPRCLQKFAADKGVSAQAVAAILAGPKKGPGWWTNKLFLVTVVVLVLVVGSYIVPFLVPFRLSLWMYFKTIWWAITLGLLLGGLIDHFIPRTYISKVLAKPRTSTVFKAVGLGFLMSACSHGILALSIELYRKGASVPAVIAFLLASPWANLSITILLFGFFGWKALLIITAAVVIAIITGLVYQWLDRKNMIEKNPHSLAVDEQFSILADIRQRMKNTRFTAVQLEHDLRGVFNGAVALGNMVLWWLVLGMGLASLIAAYVPAHVFHAYIGPTWMGLLITLAAATVIEVCSEGSAPLAFEIFRQTGALGNSFVFLMAGVVTDYTEIGLLWTNIGRRTALWLPVIAVPQVVVVGVLMNMLLK
jgi:uncharacterized membrane protein YraQ (UPF0718 family)/YHS domain-containing protein